MTEVFTSLDTVLQEGEALTFKLSRHGGNLVALLIPVLTHAPKEASPDLEKARAALSQHLRLDMPPAQLDAEFADRVRGYGTVRRDIPRHNFRRRTQCPRRGAPWLQSGC